MVYAAWLRRERRKWPAVEQQLAEKDRAGGRKAFWDVLRQWHDRAHDARAPVSLIWWNWPLEYWTRIRDGARLGLLKEPAGKLMANYTSGECDEVTKEMDRFESAGFLEKSDVISTVNPMAFVPKKETGKGRIITDSKKSGVNSVLPSPPVWLPTIDDVKATKNAAVAHPYHALH